MEPTVAGFVIELTVPSGLTAADAAAQPPFEFQSQCVVFAHAIVCRSLNLAPRDEVSVGVHRGKRLPRSIRGVRIRGQPTPWHGVY